MFRHVVWFFRSECAGPARQASPELVRFSMWPLFVHMVTWKREGNLGAELFCLKTRFQASPVPQWRHPETASGKLLSPIGSEEQSCTASAVV